ncbi:MAG: signal peptidase I [Pseudomonadota bacterium]
MSEKEKFGLFKAKNAKSGDWIEALKTIVFAVILAMIFRSFVYEPFHIPSGSMKQNLLVGDYIFVSKFSYGYNRYSFPWLMKLMPFDERVFRTAPKRGDIVVFHPPGFEPLGPQYIKRLIGLPGDKIQMKSGVLYINDVAMKKEYIDDWHDADKNTDLKRYKETLPEGQQYNILNEYEPSIVEDTDVYTVPEKHYFMMGDNRDNSRDSRYSSPVGFVPEANIVGRADLILFSWSCGFICSNRFFIPLHR